MITQKQLDALHLEHARKNNVTVLTLEQFKKRFFDGGKYLSKRERAPFGSARDPANNSIEISNNAYVSLPMIELARTKKSSSKHSDEIFENNVTLDNIKKYISNGFIVVMIAPFGSGKSLTTREIFKSFSKEYYSGESSLTPICLNLREHWGQQYFDEMLERHARSIGFTPKEDLVSAWRAGLSILLLDGFDEVASQSIVRNDDINFMRAARRVALEGVKDFLTKLPTGMGAFICGRDHYFDHINELSHALGLSGREYKLIKLGEFTEDGANEFLARNGINAELPDWLPRKPLLLSYLIQEKLLQEVLEIDASLGYGYVWDTFIKKITERESGIEKAVMDSQTLRDVMERLAFHVRATVSGTGPISGNDLANTYKIETGQVASEGVLAQLQRLPGLTQRDQEAGSRSFVDSDMLAALQGGALAKLIWGQYNDISSSPLSALSDKAIDVAAYLIKKDGGTSTTLLSVIDRLVNDTSTKYSSQLAADCISVAFVLSRDEGIVLDFHEIVIKSAFIGNLYLEEYEIKNIRFDDCIISEIILSSEALTSGIHFNNCIISKVKGISSRAGLPKSTFSDSCECDVFDYMGTNNAVLKSDLEPNVKALLTVLRKLYKQSGAGRKMNALTRGMRDNSITSLIPSILKVLEKHEFIRIYNNVVHPVRKKSDRVEQILDTISICKDPLVDDVRALKNT
ncbi:hypothetical protein [Aeromonas enteropelogenes]|uniref:NACHT domain-containing protein n=1 Tax=Aeromonas enteropelogenes TaxID=29489 RepID=UPI003F746B7C